MGSPDTLEVAGVLTWAGFSPFRRISGRLGVSDIFDAGDRMGIYVLKFKDGSYYVGQTQDVTARYREHRDAKSPIEAITFRSARSKELDRAERDTIRALELIGVPLKNVTLTQTGGSSELVDADWATELEKRRFSCESRWNDLTGTPHVDSTRRTKLLDRFERFVKEPLAKSLIEGFSRYLVRCVPFPARTACHRWVVSALPQGYRSKHYANLSVGWQWTAVCFEGEGVPVFQFYGRGSILKRSYGRELAGLAPTYCDVENASEVMGGTDQLRLICRYDEVQQLLQQDAVVESLRDVALHLMDRKTPYASSHCFALADAILLGARQLA